jgi:hypothetical protein
MFLTLLTLSTSAAFHAAAVTPTPVQTVARAISDYREYTLRIKAPGVETATVFRKMMGTKDTSWSGWRIVPHLIALATTADGKGEVTLTFEFAGLKDPIVLRSRGLPEDVYLLRTLGGETDAAKWLDKVVPTSKMVMPWPEKQPEPSPAMEQLKKVPPELEAAVKLGQETYELKRAELIRRFNKSFLHYPESTEMSWAVYSGKDILWLETACSDRMYVADFRVELRKTDKGEWEVVRILAKELFKGE